MSDRDDIRQLVIQEANRNASGATGDVSPAIFESLFEKELRKYERLAVEMQALETKQGSLLAELSVSLISRLHFDPLAKLVAACQRGVCARETIRLARQLP